MEKILNICMYCGETENLTKEHIIPLGMGGDLVFPKSSCKKCARITSLDERKVLRGFMYEGRLAGNLPSRRKGKQPKTFKRILVREDGVEFTKELLVNSGISVIHLPIFNEPGILGGEFPISGINIRELGTIHLNIESMHELNSNEGVTSCKFQTEVDVSSFCKVLSKIAYGYHVYTEGVFPREESPALAIILNSEPQYGKWIGSKNVVFPESKALHLVNLHKLPNEDGTMAYVVALNLFFGWGMNSTYLVTTRIAKNA